MHGHAGLPLHHEGAVGDEKKRRQSSAPSRRARCSLLNALPATEELPPAPSQPPAPFHQVPEELHDPLLQHGPVLDDGVALVGHFLLQLFQLLDLLPGL